MLVLNKTGWHPIGCKDSFIDRIAQGVARKLVYSKYFDDYSIAYGGRKIENQASVGNYSDKVWGGKRLYTTLGDFQNNEQGMKRWRMLRRLKMPHFGGENK